jgi:enterochelin esterase-like enzyme
MGGLDLTTSFLRKRLTSLEKWVCVTGRRWCLFALISLIGLLALGCQPQPTLSDTSPILKATSTPTITPSPIVATSTSAPAPTNTEVFECSEITGTTMEGSYRGVVYKQEVPFIASLPPCYSLENRSYPVVYLLHGYPYDQTHWLELSLITTYEGGFNRGEWPGIIFVLPFVPEQLFIHTDGGVGSYEQEFLEGLVPFIESEFRVLESHNQRVLGGVSRGGVWALEIGLRNADQFDHVIAVSPSLVNNYPRPPYDPFEIVREERDFPATIFISTAEDETPFRQAIEAFVSVLEQEEITHSFLLHPGNHSDDSWRAVMGEILTQLFLDITP